MKLWRKQAKKYRDEHGDLKRNGKQLAQIYRMTSSMKPQAYPLLEALLTRAGIVVKQPEIVQEPVVENTDAAI